MSTLGAARIHRLTLSIPAFEAWRADLTLEGGAVPQEGTVQTLSVAGLDMVGTVLRAKEDAPDKPRCVLVGGAGWERPVTPPPSYQSDGGVRLSNVLADLAKRAGETIEQPQDTTIGSTWAYIAAQPQQEVRLRDVLFALYRDGFVGRWRVDPDGVTRFGARTGSAVTARAQVLTRNAAVGLISVGIDTPAAFLPGGTFEAQPIRKLVVVETPGNLTAELWVAAPSIKASVLRMVGDAFPALIFNTPRTYIVHQAYSDGRMDLMPPPDATYLPELARVEQWVPPGMRFLPAVGTSVIVQFRDANPTRPVVTGVSPFDLAALPSKTEIDASGPMTIGYSATLVTISTNTEIPVSNTGRPVRYGDTVTVGAVTGPISTVGPVARIQM